MPEISLKVHFSACNTLPILILISKDAEKLFGFVQVSVNIPCKLIATGDYLEDSRNSRKASAENAFRVMMGITPDALRYPFHIFLIRHGRRVCKSQKPNCPECVVRGLCPSRSE